MMLGTIKKILIIIALITIISTFGCYGMTDISTISNTPKPVRVGVLYYGDNVFYSLVRKNLEDIQKENETKVQFTFFDGKRNPAIESELLNNMIKDDFDLIFANISDQRRQDMIDEYVDKAKAKNIPIIFFNVTPTKLDAIRKYSKSLIISTDTVQSGVLQGQMIADAWHSNKETMDKNGDNIMQYIMLKGNLESFSTEAKSKYSILAINNAGIKTQELESVVANWDTEIARSTIKALFLKYGSQVEVIIANNDAMAIGAVKALQEYGYNIGDPAKTIPVFGINAIPEAQELITKGFMAGSVPQNPQGLAEALYTVGINLVSGRQPLEGTNYKFDETGVTILIPYK